MAIKRNFVSYSEASDYAKSVGIKSGIEYIKWTTRPKFMPSDPRKIYQTDWKGWEAFLGAKFLTFSEACIVVRKAGIRSANEFKKWDRPKNMPSQPSDSYNDEWDGWEFFLDCKPPKQPPKNFLSYSAAKAYMRTTEISNSNKFIKWSIIKGRPIFIPSDPERVYNDEWSGWDDFLGMSERLDYLSFSDAIEYLANHNIKTRPQFKKWLDKPSFIPEHPQTVYKDEWQGWAHFFGIARKRTTEFLSFNDARQFVIDSGITFREEYKRWKKPTFMPSHPDLVYKDEWQDWEYFLNSKQNIPSNKFMTFEEAKMFMTDKGILTAAEYKKWKEKPDNLPGTPNKTYKKDWIDWFDFLNLPKPIKKMCYKDAKKYISTTEINSGRKFKEWKNRPEFIPSDPPRFYKNDWLNWQDFLSNENIDPKTRKESCLSFEEAKKFVKSVGINSQAEYLNWKNRPIFLPASPDRVYKNDWNGYGDFLDNHEYQNSTNYCYIKDKYSLKYIPKRLLKFGHKNETADYDFTGIYNKRKEANSKGKVLAVDHIDPIGNNDEKLYSVVGLHTPNNLTLLSKSQNSCKSNRFTCYRIDTVEQKIYWLVNDKWTETKPFNYKWSVEIDGILYQ